MELFRPDIKGDILYFDLDTTIVRDIEPLTTVQNITMLQQDYYKNRIGSGVMFWPEGTREQVWEAWNRKKKFHKNGDQAFIESLNLKVDTWQSVRPGMLVSYKCVVKPRGTVPASARVVYFHGKPRPWAADVVIEHEEPPQGSIRGGSQFL